MLAMIKKIMEAIQAGCNGRFGGGGGGGEGGDGGGDGFFATSGLWSSASPLMIITGG